MTGSSLSTTWLQRVLDRDAAAWERMIQLYYGMLCRRCQRLGLQDSSARDVVQEVFTAAWDDLASFRRNGPASCFRAWLWGIAWNKLKDYWKRQSNQPQALGDSEAQRRFDELEASTPELIDSTEYPAERSGLLHRAAELICGEFEVPTWKAFELFAINGKPAAEVAVELGLSSANAVHVAVCRVRKRLREEFAGEFPDTLR
jgi:RNA polymerase sigma-70 factor, ECF subfamily